MEVLGRLGHRSYAPRATGVRWCWFREASVCRPFRASRRLRVGLTTALGGRVFGRARAVLAASAPEITQGALAVTFWSSLRDVRPPVLA